MLHVLSSSYLTLIKIFLSAIVPIKIGAEDRAVAAANTESADNGSMNDVIKAIKNPESIVYKKTDTSGRDSGDHDVNSSSSKERHTTLSLSPHSSEKSSRRAP